MEKGSLSEEQQNTLFVEKSKIYLTNFCHSIYCYWYCVC